jgi:hypothetical protein
VVTHGGGELEVLIGAGGEAGETLLLVGRPRADGHVLVRAWPDGEWGREPEARDRSAADVLHEIERAVRQGRSVRPEVGAVRNWLEAR